MAADGLPQIHMPAGVVAEITIGITTITAGMTADG
jgi:hypothetical protein